MCTSAIRGNHVEHTNSTNHRPHNLARHVATLRELCQTLDVAQLCPLKPDDPCLAYDPVTDTCRPDPNLVGDEVFCSVLSLPYPAPPCPALLSLAHSKG